MERRGTRIALTVWAGIVIAFLWIPIAIICVYAFNKSNVQSWPIAGFSTKWFSPAIHDPNMQAALKLSLEAAALATTIALVLGTTARPLGPEPPFLRQGGRSRSCSCCRSRSPGSSRAWR